MTESFEDLREILTEFWLEAMQKPQAEFCDRIKASELLAKYILDGGSTPIKGRGSKRLPTADILRHVEALER